MSKERTPIMRVPARRWTDAANVMVIALLMLGAAVCDAGAQSESPGPGTRRARASARVAGPTVQVQVPDSVIVSVHSVRDPVAVTLPTVATRTTRDWFDWLGLLGALLVAPIFALLAAQRGARIGGEEARRAAIEVQIREATDARRLRAEERDEEGRRERALLLRRFERDLTTAGGLADALRITQQITPVMPMSAANLRAMWDSFVRRRDAVMLLADPDVEHEVEFFYEWVFSRSTSFDTWLATERDLLSVGNPDWDEIHRRAAAAEEDVRTHVERAQSALPRLRARVEQLAPAVAVL